MPEPRISADDRSGVRVFPPFLFVGAGALAFAIQRFYPLRFAPAERAAPLRIVGGVLVLAAAALAIWAVLTFRRAGTTPNPAGGTTALALDGPYRFSRNPMYLSLALLTTGAALAFDTLWPLLFLPAVLWLVRRNVIDPEERYLGSKFGESYRAYTARVRRWL